MNPENPSEKKPMDCIVSEDGCACDYCEDIRKRLASLQSQNSTLLSLVRECKIGLEEINKMCCCNLDGVAKETLSLIEKSKVLK